ncbi:Ig-like domain-containing protein, partial [Lyngbya sp. CCY1209]|uniref:Ig-like domain-containing protein n=1 Tax=Lyngbya sp. CCY1209 TaxID=2886103 RepID=UPI002D20F4B6
YQDGTELGTTIADADGNWTFTPTAALAEGIFSLTAQATDAAGNISEISTAVSLTVDTTAPDTTPPDAPIITSDGITNDTTPDITGIAEPGSTVTIFRDGTELGTTTADDSGNWSFTPATALAEGTFNLTATAADAAG